MSALRSFAALLALLALAWTVATIGGKRPPTERRLVNALNLR